MISQRTLTVREYISELVEEGKIKDRPLLGNGYILRPISVVEKNERFFIAKSARSNMTMDDSDNFLINDLGYFAMFDLIYYPTNLNHAEILSKSDVLDEGPQSWFPGSVAVLAMYCRNWKSYEFSYLQYSFKQGSPSELTRGLASKYMSARYHLLRHFFENFLLEDIREVYVFGDFEKKNASVLERIMEENEVFRTQFKRCGNIFFRSNSNV